MYPEDPGKGLGTASLVLSILGLTGIGLIGSIIGLILGGIGQSKSKKAGLSNGNAKAGVIISIIGLVIWILIIMFYGGLILALLSPLFG